MVLLEKLTYSRVLKKFSVYWEILRFIIVYTTARHFPLSWNINLVHVISFYLLRSVTLPSAPGYSKWTFSFRFPHQNPVCISHFPWASVPLQFEFSLFNFDHSVKTQLWSPHFTCFRTFWTGQILKAHSIFGLTACLQLCWLRKCYTNSTRETRSP
jgi:hypothetical protein